MYLLPPTLLALLFSLTSASASPSPPLLDSDYAISLWPRDLLFYRQVKDLQTFDSALGGVRASSIMNSGIPDRPFDVGGSSFPDFKTAAQRSCDEQFQGCQKMANSAGGGGGGGDSNNGGGGSNNGDGKRDGKGQDGKDGGKGKKRADGDNNGGKLTVNMCDDQKDKCNQAQQTAKVQDFNSPVASTNMGQDPQFPDFDLICEG
ncbi:hypothetical protein E8E11_005224 [Didymella keratinophila]|nr:hypothetical protein E8E11_005224 [Didymella keratinophila]